MKAPGVTGTVSIRRSHGAAAGKAEIDFGGMRMAVIGADLSGLPASDGEVALGDFAENFLDMVLEGPTAAHVRG